MVLEGNVGGALRGPEMRATQGGDPTPRGLSPGPGQPLYEKTAFRARRVANTSPANRTIPSS